MKKSLLVFALPILLLTACGKSSGGSKEKTDEGPISFEQFQQMSRDSLDNGLEVSGEFTVNAYTYDYNAETDEVAEDYRAFTTINYIRNGQELYCKEDADEYILNFEDRTVLKKTEGSWVKQVNMSPNQISLYTRDYSYAVMVAMGEIGSSKNGEYKSTASRITYNMKNYYETKYDILYAEKDGVNKFEKYTRSFFFVNNEGIKTTLFRYEVNINSYKGTFSSIL